MKLYSIIFSPTGGTKKVAELLSSTIPLEKETIDLSNPDADFHYVFDEHDICMICVPSYGGRVPSIVVERLHEMNGNGCRSILVVVYGNRAYDDTLMELKEVTSKLEFNCIGAISAIAQHSIMSCYGELRPDVQDILQLQGYGRQLYNVIQQETRGDVIVPGNEIYREYKGVPLKPSVDKHCNECGLCVSNCPVKAIDLQHPSCTNHDICISCMRCIQICPQHARKVNKLLLLGATKALKKACSERKENALFLGE